VYRALKINALGVVSLAASLSLNAGFVYWLVSETAAERAIRIHIEYDTHAIENGFESAKQMVDQALAKEPRGLNLNWLPILLKARTTRNEELGYYERILVGAPDREATYHAIAELLKTAPEAFLQKMKPSFLQSLFSIPGIHVELLEKYHLLAE
jgi:hypothetical protein